MATDRDQPWWAEAQDYRHRTTRRRALDPDLTAGTDEFSSAAARRRRAAAARAAAQERRARQRRSAPAEFGWVDESPFAAREEGRDGHRRTRERARRHGAAGRPSSGTLPVRSPRGARRVGRRRRTPGPIARPEKLLLYAALLGLFLVLAAASTSDAAALPHVVALPR